MMKNQSAMKKNYLSPETWVVRLLEETPILTASFGVYNKYTDNQLSKKREMPTYSSLDEE